MSYAKKTLFDAMDILRALPNGTHFDVGNEEPATLSFQAATQEEVRKLRAFFPGCVWRKSWNDGGCSWWEYDTEFRGFPVKIYAVSEAPPTCHAITEEREVEVQVPLTFETRKRTEKVIVGWSCGDEAPMPDEVKAASEVMEGN